MINNRDIVIIGLQAWDIEIGSNCKDIAREFSKHNRVLYVNSPLDRITKWRNRRKPQVKKRLDVIRGMEPDLVQEGKNLWVLNPRTSLESISRLRWNWLFDRINRLNNLRFAREIRSAVERLHFKEPILFNDGNMFRGLHLKELIKPRLSVYYFRDNYLAMDFWKVQGRRIQPELMAKSDLVLTNSSYLERMAKPHNPHTRNVGQGFDHLLYDKRSIRVTPSDFASIRKPVIGYAGALLSLRLDLEIIRYIALQKTDWNIVLIGPEDETFQKSGLHEIPNIYFLGLKNPAELPLYIHQFDVAINPQVLNDVTRGNYPRKIDEYLALGKPVVATVTEAMSMFASQCYLANNQEEYVQLITSALEENSPERERQRIEFANTHSWENNIAVIYRLMSERMSELTH